MKKEAIHKKRIKLASHIGLEEPEKVATYTTPSCPFFLEIFQS